MPAALCDSCHILLRKKDSESTTVLPQVDDYDPERNLVLRSASSCACKICHVASASINNALAEKKKRGRPKIQETPEREFFKICSHCFSCIGSGYPHDCSSRHDKVDNITELLSNTPTSSQRVSSRIILNTETPFLATLGSKVKVVSSGETAPKKQSFSAEQMSFIQKDLNLSNNQMSNLSEDLRVSSGSRKLIESGVKGKL